ncbi:MAG: peptidyl-prolyl cis-trans isomerase [Deltaproteobacteria bacterium]|nr:peptidyl-prolyl cis-trans isomerase [Deltaproteobacteria bacterium]
MRRDGHPGLVVAGMVAGLALGTGCPSQGGAAGGGGGANTSFRFKPGKPGTPVATVGDTAITVEDFQDRINQQGPFARPRFADVAKRREFLDGLIRQEVLAQEAVRRGMLDDPEVQDALKKVLVQKLTRQEYDSQVKQEDIKAEDVKKYYDANPDEFHKPEMVRCAAIVVQNGADPAAARKKAEGFLKQVKEAAARKPEPGKFVPDAFGDLAAQVSEDPETKQLRGDLRYLSRKELDGKWGEKVGEACFGLAEVNDLSGVVEGKTGMLVLKNTGRRKPIDRTLEQVETQIRNRLFREKRTEAFNRYVDGLRQKLGVRVDDQKLAAMQIAGATQQPPPMPGAPPALQPPGGDPVITDEPSKEPHGH